MSGAPSPVEAARAHYIAAPAERVGGQIEVPGDKSISHRSLLLGAIAHELTSIEGFLAGEDCLATLAVLRTLGVRIEQPAPTSVRVHGVGPWGLQGSSAALDLGNSGTAIRLMMGLLSAQRFDSTLIGDGSLMRRPMERVAQPLRAMGAHIDTQAGCPPVRIHGGASLQGIDYAMPVASAQVKSALLLAGLYAHGTTRISEPAPTRDHSERMLRAFGARVEQAGGTVSLTGGQALRGCPVQVPGDFSSAAFFLVAGCLAAQSGLLIRNVGCNPTRTGLLQMLSLMGARVQLRAHAPGPRAGAAAGAAGGAAAQIGEPVADIHVQAGPLRGIRVPEELVPLAIDEFPVFFIAAAAAEGETVVTGAAELRVKESDRLAVMAQGLTALGVACELLPDGLVIHGMGGLADGRFDGGRIDSHGDHRIAMAFAIASLRARAPIWIDDVANVATSFPGFVGLAHEVGLQLTA